MILVSNTAEQTLEVGQSLTFNTFAQSGCGESFRNNSGSVGLTCSGFYEVSFNANVGGTTAAAPVQLSIEIGGSPLVETTMISTPAAVGDLNNVAATTLVQTKPRVGNNITVTNTGANPIVIGANPSLAIRHLGR